MAFKDKKAAPFVKGGGRSKKHPNDAKGNKKAAALAALKAAKSKELSKDTKFSEDLCFSNSVKDWSMEDVRTSFNKRQSDKRRAAAAKRAVGGIAPSYEGPDNYRYVKEVHSNHVIVNGDDGNSHARIPYDVQDDGSFKFGSEEPVKQVYVPAKKKKGEDVKLSLKSPEYVDLAGKDGSTWKHGYIPTNPAAVALKAHKTPKGTYKHDAPHGDAHALRKEDGKSIGMIRSNAGGAKFQARYPDGSTSKHTSSDAAAKSLIARHESGAELRNNVLAEKGIRDQIKSDHPVNALRTYRGTTVQVHSHTGRNVRVFDPMKREKPKTVKADQLEPHKLIPGKISSVGGVMTNNPTALISLKKATPAQLQQIASKDLDPRRRAAAIAALAKKKGK